MLSPEQEAEIRRDVAFTKGDRHWRYQGEAAWGVSCRLADAAEILLAEIDSLRAQMGHLQAVRGGEAERLRAAIQEHRDWTNGRDLIPQRTNGDRKLWRMLEAHQVDEYTPNHLGSDGGRMGDEPPSE